MATGENEPPQGEEILKKRKKN